MPTNGMRYRLRIDITGGCMVITARAQRGLGRRCA